MVGCKWNLCKSFASKNGKITLFFIRYTGFDVVKGTDLTVVLTPDVQARLIAQRGLAPYIGVSMLKSRSNWFSRDRCASTVPPDLYSTWYDFYRRSTNWRKAQMDQLEENVKGAQLCLERGRLLYILPGDQ